MGWTWTGTIQITRGKLYLWRWGGSDESLVQVFGGDQMVTGWDSLSSGAECPFRFSDRPSVCLDLDCLDFSDFSVWHLQSQLITSDWLLNLLKFIACLFKMLAVIQVGHGFLSSTAGNLLVPVIELMVDYCQLVLMSTWLWSDWLCVRDFCHARCDCETVGVWLCGVWADAHDVAREYGLGVFVWLFNWAVHV